MVENDDTYEIDISSQFQESLQHILAFLKAQSYQNYQQFEKYIAPQIFKIGENPYAFPLLKTVKTKRVYRYVLFRKSFNIFYRISGYTIFIVDIVHYKKNPKYLKNLDKI